jgi:hypothetical protein
VANERQRSRSKRWARNELRGRHCPACDLRTTHAYDECLRCERLRQTRRVGLHVTLVGTGLLLAGVGLLLGRGLDPGLPLPLEPGVLLVATGVLVIWPGLYGLVLRRWPMIELTEEP